MVAYAYTYLPGDASCRYTRLTCRYLWMLIGDNPTLVKKLANHCWRILVGEGPGYGGKAA